MSKDRPYEFVPTVAILILIENYKKFIEIGDFRKKEDLDKMLNELDIRFKTPSEDKQISIEEYMRGRDK